VGVGLCAGVLAWRGRLRDAAIPATSQRHRVTAVSDGDTLTLDGIGKARLLGIDCPESSQHGGREATEFTRRTALHRAVRVVVCPVKARDRYGRARVEVFVVDENGNERNLALELLRQGFANVYTLPPCHVDTSQWLRFAREARDARRGLWATVGEVPSAHSGATRLTPERGGRSDFVFVSANGKRYHRRGCRSFPKRPQQMTRAEAAHNGYTPCKVCGG